jgi:hypothetical protein
LDTEGQQAFISIKKSGEILKIGIIEPGDKFEYYDASETRIVSMKLESIFNGTATGNYQFTNIYLRFGESNSTPTASPTITITSVQTESTQNEQPDNLNDDVLLFGLSTPMILIILILVILIIERKKE